MQAGLNNINSNNLSEPLEHKFNHNQRRTFSYNQKDECWNNVNFLLKMLSKIENRPQK